MRSLCVALHSSSSQVARCNRKSAVVVEHESSIVNRESCVWHSSFLFAQSQVVCTHSFCSSPKSMWFLSLLDAAFTALAVARAEAPCSLVLRL